MDRLDRLKTPLSLKHIFRPGHRPPGKVLIVRKKETANFSHLSGVIKMDAEITHLLGNRGITQ